jgi:hypothetical protein
MTDSVASSLASSWMAPLDPSRQRTRIGISFLAFAFSLAFGALMSGTGISAVGIVALMGLSSAAGIFAAGTAMFAAQRIREYRLVVLAGIALAANGLFFVWAGRVFWLTVAHFGSVSR